MAGIKVDGERCKGCELCVAFCPRSLISMSKQFNSRGYRYAELTDPERCTGCAICGRGCPDVAIEVYR
ncbi:MAG: 4Fe-4S dicluster domain-containing protein [Firmicutes bacterium]|nr:4Fe-4S dicluster domain-containing protein [Bacillota bacterium]